MSDNAGENVNAKKGQRDNEHVEEAVVPLSNAVAHPRTVVIKTFCFHEKIVIKIWKKDAILSITNQHSCHRGNNERHEAGGKFCK